MQTPSWETPVSSKAPNQGLKDMDVLCTLKIKMESQNSDHGFIKVRDHIQIKIKMPNPSQEPPLSPKAPNEGLKDMDVLCTLKIKIESPNLDQGYIKAHWPYPNQEKDAKTFQEPPASSKAPKKDFKDMQVLRTFKIKTR